jgi:hypothetical protein
MRVLVAILSALLLLTLAPGHAAAAPENPLKDHDHDGDMEAAGACLWGFSDDCVLQAYECLQPYAPGFGITCI